MSSNSASRSKAGFTLVELMIVVLIVGLLAALAVPAFAKVRQNSKTTRFVHDLRSFSYAAENYMLESGKLPPDTASGAFPEELVGYISSTQFEKETPLGGQWDFERDTGEFASSFGAHGLTAPIGEIERVDEMLDDGNLATGSFREIAEGRYYLVLVE